MFLCTIKIIGKEKNMNNQKLTRGGALLSFNLNFFYTEIYYILQLSPYLFYHREIGE